MTVDEAWAPLARASRDALALLGYATAPRCLPGEPGHPDCGGTFAEHAAAHLIALHAVADHHLAHLQPPEEISEQIYHAIDADIDCAKTCT